MKIFKYINKEILSQNNLKFKCTSSTILNTFLNKNVSIYNGNEYKSFYISSNCINTKLGKYVVTRKFCKHSKPKRRNKIRIKKK